jgi:hypothetical protein
LRNTIITGEPKMDRGLNDVLSGLQAGLDQNTRGPLNILDVQYVSFSFPPESAVGYREARHDVATPQGTKSLSVSVAAWRLHQLDASPAQPGPDLPNDVGIEFTVLQLHSGAGGNTPMRCRVMYRGATGKQRWEGFVVAHVTFYG